MKQIQLLELFGGIGAATQALKNLNVDFKTIDYVEWDEKRVQAYNAMNPFKYRPQDVRGWNLKPDILVHGSPCQDNSRVNKSRKGNARESRSQLLNETVRIIKEMGDWRPAVVVWENVKGVLDKSVMPVFSTYLNDMKELGYTNSFDVLDARDFGIPQARERVFCISLLGNKAFDFGKLKRKPMQSIEKFLEKDVHEKYTVTTPSMIKRLPGSNKIGNYNGSTMEEIKDYCLTITTRQDRCPNAGVLKLPDGNYRYLTELECWRLLGFKDEEFRMMESAFPGKADKMNRILYALAGNSIVVQVLEAIFEVVLNEDYAHSIVEGSTGQLELIC